VSSIVGPVAGFFGFSRSLEIGPVESGCSGTIGRVVGCFTGATAIVVGVFGAVGLCP
jgi:hypothetical protein